MGARIAFGRIALLVVGAVLFLTLARPVCAQTSNAIWAWGNNSQGQLGNGTSASSAVPVQTSGLAGVAAISEGSYHSLAIDRHGAVWAWGDNGYAELGTGNYTDANAPVKLTSLSGAVAVSAGHIHSLALDSSGVVWAWGDNADGELGNGTSAASSSPVRVSNLSTVTAIAAGYTHSLALDSSGAVWAWGGNTFGELGNGTLVASTVPVKLTGISGVTAISAGSDYSLALDSSGVVWAWGGNTFGELGNGTLTASAVPVRVTGLTEVTAIACGASHALALDKVGRVWTWGDNSSGQLGNGTYDDSDVPIQVVGLSGVKAVAGGAAHSLALDKAGAVWAWGNDSYGQLGNGTNSGAYVPVQILSSTGAVAIAAGGFDSLAIFPVSGAVRSISVRPINSTVVIGSPVTLHVAANYRDGTTRDVSLDSATTYAVAHGSGTLSGPTYLSLGPEAAVITVSYSANGATFYGAAYITSTYVHGRIVSSTFTPYQATVSYPDPVTFSFTVTYVDGTTVDVSTNPDTVYTLRHGVGTLTGNTYTSIRPEAAVITAAYTDPATGQTINKAAYISENVAAVLKSITITPTRPSVALGSVVVWTVTAHYSDGSTADVSALATATAQYPSYGTTSGNSYTPTKVGANLPVTVSYSAGAVTATVISYVTAH